MNIPKNQIQIQRCYNGNVSRCNILSAAEVTVVMLVVFVAMVRIRLILLTHKISFGIISRKNKTNYTERSKKWRIFPKVSFWLR